MRTQGVLSLLLEICAYYEIKAGAVSQSNTRLKIRLSEDRRLKKFLLETIKALNVDGLLPKPESDHKLNFC